MGKHISKPVLGTETDGSLEFAGQSPRQSVSIRFKERLSQKIIWEAIKKDTEHQPLAYLYTGDTPPHAHMHKHILIYTLHSRV